MGFTSHLFNKVVKKRGEKSQRKHIYSSEINLSIPVQCFPNTVQCYWSINFLYCFQFYAELI